MDAHRHVFLATDDADEREAVVGPLTLDCPFCGEEIGGLASETFSLSRRCSCGAAIVRTVPGASWPSTPATMAQAWRELRARLSETILGHEDAVSQLAVLGARHLHRTMTQRALVIGPSGTGKTSMASALSEAIDCVGLVWDVSVSAEAGWAGVDANEVFAELYRASEEDIGRLSKAILALDEVDKLALRGAEGTSREHRLGQQKSLLGIVGGGVPVTFHGNGDRGALVSVRTDAMLILGLGSFDGLPEDAGPRELVEYGYMPEFASRWPVLLRLGGLDRRALKGILKRGITEAVAAAHDFGFDIRISDAAVGYAAAAVEQGGREVTPRSGIGWLLGAVDHALITLLDLGAAPGTVYELQADDVRLPPSLQPPRRKR